MNNDEDQNCIIHEKVNISSDYSNLILRPLRKHKKFKLSFPSLHFRTLSDMFNKIQSPFLICYPGSKLVIDRYDFNVELIVQAPV